jgi:hypothetical protein
MKAHPREKKDGFQRRATIKLAAPKQIISTALARDTQVPMMSNCLVHRLGPSETRRSLCTGLAASTSFEGVSSGVLSSARLELEREVTMPIELRLP